MTIAQLHQTYTAKQLSYTPGNARFRYKVFAPLFENLFDNCAVYREKSVYAVIQLTALQLDLRGVSAIAEIRHKILLSSADFVWPSRPWRFCSDWANVRLIGESLNAPYISFTIWPEAALVEEVQRLAVAGQTAEIKRLLYPEET